MRILRSVRIAVVSVISLLICTTTPASAATGSTVVTQSLLPGVIVLAVQPTALMGAVTLNGGSQSSSGSLGLSTLTDARGTGAGWSLTATTTPFSNVATPVQTVGSIGSIVTGGSYTGTSAGTYTVTIATGGVLGVATYTVSGLETQAATATGVATALGTRGVTTTFAAATYVSGEQWTIAVNIIPASNISVTPSAVTAVSGSTTGVTAGSPYSFTTGSDPATIMSSTVGNGLGVYTNTPTLNLAIPAGTKAGSYVATVTETAS